MTTTTLSRAALALLLLAACARPERPAGPTAAASAAAASAAAASAATPRAEYSLYDLGATWRDQRGAARTLGTLRGRPQALAMVYTHCAATCPLIVAELRRIAAATDAGVVLVSLDPQRDTPGRLAEWAASLDLDPARWTLLSGTDDQVLELAAAIGVRYRRLSPADLAHSNTITLLDADGAVVHQQPALAGTDETVRVARALTR